MHFSDLGLKAEIQRAVAEEENLASLLQHQLG